MLLLSRIKRTIPAGILKMMVRIKEQCRFLFSRYRRNKQYAVISKTRPSRPHSILDSLQCDGYAKIKGVLPPKILDEVCQTFDSHLVNHTDLEYKKRDGSIEGLISTPGNMTSFDESVRIKNNELRNITSYVSLSQPLLHCRETVGIVFNDLITEIASAYLRCYPALGTLNLRRSFVNSHPEFATQQFHSDGNSLHFIKFFFYLNDVTESDGPFCYVRGSHRNKFLGWDSKTRFSEEELAQHYSKNDICLVTAKKGDMILANTTGFHRGLKPLRKDRTMLTINYVIHPEYWIKPETKIHRDDYENLPDHKKPLADFLIKI